MQKALGILGGMGPQATVDLQQKIISLTDARRDAEHLRVYVDNHPQIEDRIAAILATDGPNPTASMQESLDKLAAAGAQCIAMPCVTAHYFLPQLVVPPGAQFLNMLEVAVAACVRQYAGRRAGVLSSVATAQCGLFTKALAQAGLPYLEPQPEDQQLLGRLILDVKAKAPMPEIARKFAAVTDEMASRGAEYFVLACTELPLIAAAYRSPYAMVDATTELAKAAVTACGGAVMKEN